MRYVSITTYAKLVGINRESVYKRIKRGKVCLLEDCEVPVVDLWNSQGKMTRNDWSSIKDAVTYKVDRFTGKVVSSPVLPIKAPAPKQLLTPSRLSA